MVLSTAFTFCMLPLLVAWFLWVVSPLFLPISLFCTFLVPPGLHALFMLTDPRLQTRKPEWRELPDYFARSVKPGWKIALVTVPLLVALYWNVRFFANHGTWLVVMIPLWIVMFVLIIDIMLYMMSVSSTLQADLRSSFRGAMFVLVMWPFASVFISLFSMMFMIVSAYAIIPMVVATPAFIAAIINRFVLTGLQIEILDPNAPTQERHYEKAHGINLEPSLWEKLKRGAMGKQNRR